VEAINKVKTLLTLQMTKDFFC